MKRNRCQDIITSALVAAGLAVGSAGCTSEGGLGQVEATPGCAPSDLVCLTAGLDAPIAVGATTPIELQVVSSGSAAPSMSLLSGNEAIFAADGRALTGVAPGVAAMLITSGELVMDFVHVWVRDANRIAVFRHGEDWTPADELSTLIQLLPGDEVILSAVPFHDDERLLGNVDQSWTLDSSSVTLLQVGHPSYRRLVALESGTTTVTVTALGQTAQLTVEVMP